MALVDSDEVAHENSGVRFVATIMLQGNETKEAII